jgi:predicted enzyme related to lactoylglutathione lyase
MERVSGMGGMFFRSENPEELRQWYADNLGIVDPPGEVWRQEAGPTVFATFSADTEYFGSLEQAFMINFRVSDLDAMLAQLREAGAAVEDETPTADGIGRFGYATDPEGNRFELWEPAQEV